ncbi:MAG: hypothetical protein M1434_01925 [Chloroflexi bacterium]|nr:hypothetical protein [Chloroflexota bacterium]MCL5273487.1 hypothetical protein [Chloroflexota bacterium]
MSLLKILTDRAVLVCNHQTGIVTNQPTQHLVKIDGRPILVDSDPERKTIKGCTMATPTIKPCSLTLKVNKGYSDLIRVDGKRVCLETVTGLTDWTGANVNYTVRTPGQSLLAESARS